MGLRGLVFGLGVWGLWFRVLGFRVLGLGYVGGGNKIITKPRVLSSSRYQKRKIVTRLQHAVRNPYVCFALATKSTSSKTLHHIEKTPPHNSPLSSPKP